MSEMPRGAEDQSDEADVTSCGKSFYMLVAVTGKARPWDVCGPAYRLVRWKEVGYDKYCQTLGGNRAESLSLVNINRRMPFCNLFMG